MFQIVSDIEDKSGDDSSQQYFKQFVQEVLTYMTSVASLYGQQSIRQTQAKFWRALISKVYDILDKVRAGVASYFLKFLRKANYTSEMSFY